MRGPQHVAFRFRQQIIMQGEASEDKAQNQPANQPMQCLGNGVIDLQVIGRCHLPYFGHLPDRLNSRIVTKNVANEWY